MKLYGKAFFFRIINTLTASVVHVDITQRANSFKAVGYNRISMVLTRNKSSGSSKISYRLICTSVSVSELLGFTSHCKSGKLMSETYSKHWNVSDKL